MLIDTMYASEIKMFLILVLHQTPALKHVTELKYSFFFLFQKRMWCKLWRESLAVAFTAVDVILVHGLIHAIADQHAEGTDAVTLFVDLQLVPGDERETLLAVATHQQLPGTENLRQQHFRSGGLTRGWMSSKISSLHECLVDLGQFNPSIRLKLSSHSSYKITLLPQWQDVRVTNVWLYVISALLQHISPISFSFAAVRFKKILNHDIHYFCPFKSKLASHQILLLIFYRNCSYVRFIVMMRDYFLPLLPLAPSHHLQETQDQ